MVLDVFLQAREAPELFECLHVLLHQHLIREDHVHCWKQLGLLGQECDGRGYPRLALATLNHMDLFCVLGDEPHRYLRYCQLKVVGLVHRLTKGDSDQLVTWILAHVDVPDRLLMLPIEHLDVMTDGASILNMSGGLDLM